MKRRYRGSWTAAYAGFVLVLLVVTVQFVGLNSPCYHDECHFAETVESFGKDMSLATIRGYNEMSTPLPFILYALWGRIFGFALPVLRLFSLLVAALTYALYYRLLTAVFGSRSITFLSAVFLTLNPYMVGLSIFVYTDMLTLLFIILSCIAVMRTRPVLLGVSLAGALLCRQYTVFMVAALFVYYGLLLFRKGDRSQVGMMLACGCSLIPLCALVLLWQGLSPDNQVRTVYLDRGLYYHPRHLTLYVSMFCVYLFPFIAVNWQRLYRNVLVLAVSCILGLSYWLMPVSASPYTVMIDKFTTGLFHRALEGVTGSTAFVHSIYFLLYTAGIPVVWYVIGDLVRRVRRKSIDFSLFLDLCLIGFLAVMPCAYMAWEKYFLLIVPIGIMRFLLLAFPQGIQTSAPVDPACA